MPNWDAIMDEAERLADQLLKQGVDLAEAEKLLHYFAYKDFSSRAVSEYLTEMSQNPPPRSKRSQIHFRNLKQIWDSWRTNLEPADKARAWGWAVREVKARREEQ